MGRCDDFPACGHYDPDGTTYCPDQQGRFPCVYCGSALDRGARSSICADCQRRPGRGYPVGSREWEDAMDMDGGWPDEPDDVECPACSGEGRVEEDTDCALCAGAGSVDDGTAGDWWAAQPCELPSDGRERFGSD